MDRSIAEQLMQCYLALDGPLNSATILSDSIENQEEKSLVRRGVASVTAKIFIDLMRPIIRQYPDLDPDKD
jgi:hypothetical protein